MIANHYPLPQLFQYQNPVLLIFQPIIFSILQCTIPTHLMPTTCYLSPSTSVLPVNATYLKQEFILAKNGSRGLNCVIWLFSDIFEMLVFLNEIKYCLVISQKNLCRAFELPSCVGVWVQTKNFMTETLNTLTTPYLQI